MYDSNKDYNDLVYPGAQSSQDVPTQPTGHWHCSTCWARGPSPLGSAVSILALTIDATSVFSEYVALMRIVFTSANARRKCSRDTCLPSGLRGKIKQNFKRLQYIRNRGDAKKSLDTCYGNEDRYVQIYCIRTNILSYFLFYFHKIIF